MTSDNFLILQLMSEGATSPLLLKFDNWQEYLALQSTETYYVALVLAFLSKPTLFLTYICARPELGCAGSAHFCAWSNFLRMNSL